MRSSAQEPAIYVNGKPLDDNEKIIMRLLEAAYQTPCPPGRYWYDRATGMFGVEGEGMRATIHSNLPLGGPLKANASATGSTTGTGTYINGRELHLNEVRSLSTCVTVPKGRFWMDANGNVGEVGGRDLGNLIMMCQQTMAARAAAGGATRNQSAGRTGTAQGSNSGSRNTNSGQNGSRALGRPGNRGWYGSVSGGGGTVGAIFSDGTGVTCGPDGGCIY
ncbi:MAG: hypothetical protein MUF01_10935 [Bryobacterales bacterium]|nr:hypothetical protein [Bryobacterales bacterium]